MLLLAHRGASADAPENTLEAFREAARQGADGIELDAMVCGSGEVVVCHDDRLGRLAGVDLEVCRTPYATLFQLDVGSRLGFGPARIPLLVDVLRELPAPMLVNIELKCDRLRDLGLAKKVAALVARFGMHERVIVSSFNPLELLRLARADATLRRGQLIDPDRPFGVQSRWADSRRVANYSVHPAAEQVDEARVRAWKGRGRKIAAWTVDDPSEGRRLRELGVDFCITNRPGEMRSRIG
jgi:glycerophosphoryl diester phosphodiesterase